MRNTKFTYPGSSRLTVFFGSVVWFPVYKCRGCLQKTFNTKIRRISSRYSWFCLVPWMSCLQKHTEFVRRKKNFTLNWCSLVARVGCLQINLNWESSSFSLVYDICRITFNEQIETVKTLHYQLYSIFVSAYSLCRDVLFFFWKIDEHTTTTPWRLWLRLRLRFLIFTRS